MQAAAVQATITPETNSPKPITCVICYDSIADMMSTVCNRITACNNCSRHMNVCPHCDQRTTFTKVFY
jgi:hypothetical protein